MKSPSVLIAGMGNELRQDDAFGIEFVRTFSKSENMPDNVKILEVGIGGIHLVQELHSGYEVLILADAVQWGQEAGHLYFREVTDITDLQDKPVFEKRNLLADMHYTNPMRAMMLAKALGVLPEKVYIFGCEAAQIDDFNIGLSQVVEDAIPSAIIKLKEFLRLL